MRLERLVGDVLDLAKLDAHRFTVLQEEVDMEQLPSAPTRRSARRRAGADRLPARRHAQPVIITDGDRVLQIIVNLLSNAFRWTPEGGRVALELSAENGSVSVAVADNGPGITAGGAGADLPPFWSRDGGGTGLGLAIARELAVALGGRIELGASRGSAAASSSCCPADGSVEAGLADVDAVDGDARRRPASSALLDSREALRRRRASRSDEVDEQREVVDAGVPLGEQVALDALEPADQLVHQAADLGEVAADRGTCSRSPSCSASPTRAGSVDSSSAAVCGERLDLPGRARAPRRSSGRPRVAIVHRGRRYRRRSDECTSRAGLRAAARADRAAPGGAAGRVAAPRLRAGDRGGAPPRVSRAAGRAATASSSSSTTRGSCRRGSRSSSRAARCCCSSASTATSGKASRGRRGG